jgi:hypothetical protein
MKLSEFTVVSPTGETVVTAVREKLEIFGEMVFSSPNGSFSLVYHHLPIVSGTGVVVEILAVYFDVTENRRLQLKNQMMRDKSTDSSSSKNTSGSRG